MACRSCGLGFNTSTSLDEGNLNPWQPTTYLGALEDPTPVSHTLGQQSLHFDGPLQHDTLLGDLSTMSDFGWDAPTSALEKPPFSVNRDTIEPCSLMPSGSFHGERGQGSRHDESTKPKELSQPAKRTPTPSEDDERRVRKKRCGNQRSSRPGDAHQDLKCRWNGCERPGPFSTKGTLMRHIETEHVNPWSFQCPEKTCAKYFKREDNRDAHLRSVHWKDGLRYSSPRS